MDILEIFDGSGRRRQVVLDRPLLFIGRDATCDVCLAHPSVSRRHAQLQRTEQGTWLLQDLNSLNHVYFGDTPIPHIILEPGKQVRIADYRLGLREVITPLDQSETIEPLGAEDSSPSWPGLEPGWLEHLQMFQRVLLRTDQPRIVLERLAEEFQRIARPAKVAIGLTQPGGYTWEVVCPQGVEGEMLHLEAAQVHAGAEDSEIRTWTYGPRPQETALASAPYCLLFPMKGRSGVIGHVYLEKPRQAPMPTALQRYLSLYANYGGLLYENLQVNSLRLAQKAIEEELSRARQIQMELFPATFHIDNRLDLHGVNLPSVHISGDYYDLVKIGEHKVAFIIADAMGHGLTAALSMAVCHATIRMGLTLRLPWDALFKGVDSIVGQGGTTRYVTGLIGQIDLDRNELELAIAGHFPPSIIVGGEQVPVPDECCTRPWGLDLPSSWKVGRIPLKKGDWSILCFTDGITDAVIGPQRKFGLEGVLAYHKDQWRASAEDMCQGLVNTVARQQKSRTLADDQTVLVLRSTQGRAPTRQTKEAESGAVMR